MRTTQRHERRVAETSTASKVYNAVVDRADKAFKKAVSEAWANYKVAVKEELKNHGRKSDR